MPSTRQIIQRKRAVSNICKVTSTMEMISSSRYRGYYNRWLDAQDFYNSLAQMAYLLVTAQKTIEHPLMHDNTSDTFAVLVIGANRGLCGSFNSNINHLIDIHIKRAARFKKKLKVYVSGKKAVTYLRNHDIKIEKEFTGFDEVPSPEQINQIADEFIQQYVDNEIDYLGLVYTRFYSMAHQHAETLTILPLPELIDDLTTRTTVIWPWELTFEDFEFNPPVEQMFDGLSRMMIRSAVSGCFLDSALSEHLSRVVAMRNATENAESMIDDLTAEYNRARQNQITGELMDIVGGVEALT